MADLMKEEMPSAETVKLDQSELRKQRWILAVIIISVLAIIAAIVVAVIALVRNPAAATNIRDIFIIFMAFESLIIGVALVVLVIQIASLVNLLQNEIKPILQSTIQTVNTLRGTTEFLSENLVEPVIKLNSYLAGLRRFLGILGPRK
jgi:hypothetical protein